LSLEIGNILKNAREAKGISLEKLQEMTKINKFFLQAIENGEFYKLPSPFYVRTYLRLYASCVNVEPYYILRQYRRVEQSQRVTASLPVVNVASNGVGNKTYSQLYSNTCKNLIPVNNYSLSNRHQSVSYNTSSFSPPSSFANLNNTNIQSVVPVSEVTILSRSTRKRNKKNYSYFNLLLFFLFTILSILVLFFLFKENTYNKGYLSDFVGNHPRMVMKNTDFIKYKLDSRGKVNLLIEGIGDVGSFVQLRTNAKDDENYLEHKIIEKGLKYPFTYDSSKIPNL